MGKAFCIWCESGGKISPSGYFWIHPECANKMMDISQDVESIKKMLKGEHSRNEYEKEEGKSKIEIIYEFIKEMEDFRIQWEGSMKLMKSLTKPSENIGEKQK